MTRPLLSLPAKQLRAQVIAAWCDAMGSKRVVCFSCGNAARALQEVGLDVLHIGPQGALMPTRWWSQLQIYHWWPDALDATSGHLGPALMHRLSLAYRSCLGDLPHDDYDVHTGSGETLVALACAYPTVCLHAVYSASDPSRQYHEEAPLNGLVRRLATTVRTEP